MKVPLRIDSPSPRRCSLPALRANETALRPLAARTRDGRAPYSLRDAHLEDCRMRPRPGRARWLRVGRDGHGNPDPRHLGETQRRRAEHERRGDRVLVRVRADARVRQRDPHRTDTVEPSYAISTSQTLQSLPEHTPFHYRLCAKGVDGAGTCGADMLFTTTTNRDSVIGTGTVFTIPELGYVIGAAVNGSSGPDGAAPVRRRTSRSRQDRSISACPIRAR